jgi:quinol monooxygenase YgiN
MLVLMTPGGFMNASATMAIPAQSLDIPPDDGITYATVDLDETIKVFAKYGVRFLAPDEIAVELPAFPLSPKRTEDNMIHIVAILTAAHGQREALLAEFKKNLNTVRLERGCVQYHSVIDIEGGPETLTRIGPHAFIVIEQWESRAAVETHSVSKMGFPIGTYDPVGVNGGCPASLSRTGSSRGVQLG